jgi:hypothetical protein
MNNDYDVLVACETSGEIRRRLRDMGINAVSCDILPADDGSAHHIVGDAGELVKRPWGLVIAHPPCTYLANSGVRWLHTQEGRWEKMREGAEFFLRMLNANAPLVAVENPVMHKHAKAIIGEGPAFTMQPYEHGDPATKRTCWWLRGLPVIEPTRVCTPEEIAEAKANKSFDAIHKATPGPDRWKIRSKTFAGIADAAATHWGGYYLKHRERLAA